MRAAWLLVLASVASAASTRFFTLDTATSLAGSRAQGVAVRPDGGLEALPPLVPLASFEEPLAQALAQGPEGAFFVGTGHPAKVYQVRDGQRTLLAEVAADQITSLLMAPDRTLYLTTALPAGLFRWRGSQLEQVASLPEGNLWDAAFFAGQLVLAAGNPGRLLRLGTKGLELVAEIPDRHARCLAVAGERLLVGTSGKGLVLAFDGKALGVLYDSPFTEIASLAVAPDGSVWAAALTGDPTLGQPRGEGQPTVSVTTGTPPAETGRFVSELLRIWPNGAVTTVTRLEKELAGTLAWAEGGLVVGTALEGELYQLVEGQMLRLDTVDAAQVTKVLPAGQALLTQDPVRLLVRRGQPQGSFTSAPLDAAQPAQWGNFTVLASGPCQVSFRSGNSAEAGEGWSSWSEPLPCHEGTISAPPARYLQLKLQLGPGRSTVERLQLTYRQMNLPPQIKELKVYPPAEVYLKSPPPSERIVELTHPELSGIFTVLEEEKESQSQLGKRYFRVGFQTVSWKAEDANGDPLLFRLEIQRQGGPWWVVRENLESIQLALDTQALADGLYRFRLTASDAPANPETPATASQLSSWFVVDNTPPRVTIRRQGEFWLVEAEDELSTLFLAQYTRDAQRWLPLAPADGVLDGRRELFRLPAAPGKHLLSVRVVDDHYNRKVVVLEEGP